MPEFCRPIVVAVLTVCALASGASAAAAEEVNVTGTWQAAYHCAVGPCAGHERTGVFVLQQAAGSSAVTGTLNVSGGEEAPASGTVSGSTLSLEGKGAKGYSASGVETISADGLSWSGTYKDSAGTSGTLTASRPSLPFFPSAAPGAVVPRAAAIQVLCNYQVAPANFTCTASVGDASGEAPAEIPTGKVSFTATSGGFSPTAACAIVATPGSPNTASCAVTYTPATKIPAGTPAPVTGAYSGDATFAPSAAKSGAGAVVSPIVYTAAKSTGEGASAVVACPVGTPSCPVVLSLSVEEASSGAVSARKVKRRTITIGRAVLTLKGGQTRTVNVSLTASGKRLLAKHKRFSALLKVISGGRVVKRVTVKLKHK